MVNFLSKYVETSIVEISCFEWFGDIINTAPTNTMINPGEEVVIPIFTASKLPSITFGDLFSIFAKTKNGSDENDDGSKGAAHKA